MLGFIVPIKSKQTTRDWARFSRTVERTLRSACGQNHPGFRVIAVCHEVPDVGFRHPSLEFVRVDFDPPGPKGGKPRPDKHKKLLVGLERIRATQPTHIMALDADDLVSNRLAAFVAANPQANGFYFGSGYVHSDTEPRLHHLRWRFYRSCGSCHILKLEHAEAEGSGGDFWRLRHNRVPEAQRKLGAPLRPLPFPGAIYNVSHGENIRDQAPYFWPEDPIRRAAYRWLFQRKPTPAIREEFGLYPLDGNL